jgi:lipopolysaccharide biosynthesis glycosyltransferase
MNVAFCINPSGLTGLGVTISSLIRNCSDHSRLRLWFLCAGFTGNEKTHIARLLRSERFEGRSAFIDFDPVAAFGAYNSLHGDWTTYGRLLLQDLLPVEQVLYLDSDLMVELDVLELDDYDFEGHYVAAVGGGKFKYTLGNKFYVGRLGIAPDKEYFNAGVLLLNLRQWRLKNILLQCQQIADQFPRDLPSHDQSLLNILCSGNFAKLPRSFNCEWIADMPKPATAQRMILHFVGSPKPWDPFGSIIHNGYDSWNKYQDKDWAAAFGKLSTTDINRVWHIRRSYVRCIRNKILH